MSDITVITNTSLEMCAKSSAVLTAPFFRKTTKKKKKKRQNQPKTKQTQSQTNLQKVFSDSKQKYSKALRKRKYSV